MTVGVLPSTDVGDLFNRDVAAVGPVEQQGADGLGVLRDGRVALHDDVEDLLVLEHAADQDALQQDRPRRVARRPA